MESNPRIVSGGRIRLTHSEKLFVVEVLQWKAGRPASSQVIPNAMEQKDFIPMF